MFTFIIVLILIIAVLMILIVLVQNSKGGGLSSQFIGAGAGQIMGVKRTGDLLEQITWGLVIAMISLTLLSNIFLTRGETAQEGEIRKANQEKNSDRRAIPTPVPAKTDTVKK